MQPVQGRWRIGVMGAIGASLALGAAPAGAVPTKDRPPLGTWKGRIDVRPSDVGAFVPDATARVTLRITALKLHRPAGTIAYTNGTCRGTNTLVARRDGGYVLRNHVDDPQSCSQGDEIFVKRVAGGRVTVQIRARKQGTVARATGTLRRAPRGSGLPTTT